MELQNPSYRSIGVGSDLRHGLPLFGHDQQAFAHFLKFSLKPLRHVLDFDFEKLCSVSLSGDNVYCDLVDGKFFQGRGKDTPAYRGALRCGRARC